MPDSLKAAVVADDLTGAADTGVQFCALAAPFLLRPVDAVAGVAGSGGTGGLALFTNSRHDPPVAAGEKVRRAADILRRHPPRFVYKKVDSCLRGNIGAEIDALVDAMGFRAAFVAPALPGQGRTTENDIHLVRGVPVGESEIAKDPLAPVTESRLSRLIAAQSWLPVGRVDLADVAAGPTRLREVVRTLLDSGCRHITFDAAEDVHLGAIAAAANRFFPDVLLVGSAGLAASQAAWLRREKDAPELPRSPRLRRMLWICGSASPLLVRQTGVLAHGTGVQPEVVPATVLADSDPSDRQAVVRKVTAGWRRGVRIIVIAPVGSGPASDPQAVADGMAAIAVDIVRREPPDGLFLTGGDTAEAVWRRLGASAIRLEGEALPGVIRGRWVGGAMDEQTVVTKAGAFGNPETLLKLHQSLLER